MSQFFISCKESRCEGPRSFYGCFYLGPFEPGESITVANALRRTLLSQVTGLAIVSVEIEGAAHEYSSLPGVRDSVLDILLNLKEIVLKKTVGSLPFNFKPQVGYLCVRGPGVVRANDLRLPPFIQCVDPDQYIATLAEDGILNMKFAIHEGKNFIIGSKLNSESNGELLNETKNINFTQSESTEIQLENLFSNATSTQKLLTQNSIKKRRLILKKFKQISQNPITEDFGKVGKSEGFSLQWAKPTADRASVTQPLSFLQQPSDKSTNWDNFNTIISNNGLKNAQAKTDSSKNQKKIALVNSEAVNSTLNFNKFVESSQKDSKSDFLKSNPLMIDAVFSPINKVNYIIEVNDSPTVETVFKQAYEIEQFSKVIKSARVLNKKVFGIPSYGAESSELKKETQELKSNLFSTKKMALKKNKNSSFSSIKKLQSEELKFGFLSEAKKTGATSLTTDLPQLVDFINESSPLKKESLKHNIILEIWTNGSLHPREAMYIGFKRLVQLFLNLQKLQISTRIFKPKSQISYDQQNYQKLIQQLKSEKFCFVPASNSESEQLISLNQTSNLHKDLNQKTVSTDDYSSLGAKPNLNETQLKELIDIKLITSSLRSYTCLKRSNINTVRDLLQYSKKDLLSLKNFGKRSLEEIEKNLQLIGVKLKD